MEEAIGQYGGWLVGLLAVIGTIIYNSRKVAVDESALVLEKWKQFAEMHAADMTRLRAEMDKDRSRLEAELDEVRHELKEVQHEFAQFRKDSENRIRSRDEEIAGLKRTISQISQSTAVQFKRVRQAAGTTDESVTKLGDENTADHEAINRSIDILKGGLGDNSIGSEDDA